MEVVDSRILCFGVHFRDDVRWCSLKLLRQLVGLELEDGLSCKTSAGELLADRSREGRPGRRRDERAKFSIFLVEHIRDIVYKIIEFSLPPCRMPIFKFIPADVKSTDEGHSVCSG